MVVGAAGYIGSRLCMNLVSAGHDVVALDSFAYGQDYSLLPCCDNERFTVHKRDCRDVKELAGLIKLADVIYWLAAVVGLKAEQRSAEEINVTPVRRLAEIVSKSQLVIYPTTNAGYLPDFHPKEETDSMQGKTWYSKSKIAAETILLESGKAVSFRLAAVYGVSPYMRWDSLVNHLVLSAVQKRELIIYQAYAIRDILHVRDAAQALMMPISDFRMKGEVYNVGERCITKEELCTMLRTFVMDLKWSYEEKQDPEGRDYAVSYEKIEGMGFKPRRNLLESLPSIVKAALMK